MGFRPGVVRQRQEEQTETEWTELSGMCLCLCGELEVCEIRTGFLSSQLISQTSGHWMTIRVTSLWQVALGKRPYQRERR